ncbi:MAG: hypothetical protein ACYCTH_00635 [Cellulomonas sp.]
MEYARRTRAEVVAAAEAMDRARAAGLPDDLLMVILAARRAWWSEASPHPTGWPTDTELASAVAHPAARLVDEVVIAAIRRHLAP